MSEIQNRDWSGDEWRWHLDEAPYRTGIEVIEPAEVREVPDGARRVAFGFSRALEAETPDAPDHSDGWAAHAAMLSGV